MYLTSWSETGTKPSNRLTSQNSALSKVHVTLHSSSPRSMKSKAYIYLLNTILNYNSIYSTKMILCLDRGCINKCVPSFINFNQYATERQQGLCQWGECKNLSSEKATGVMLLFRGNSPGCAGLALLVGFSGRAPLHTSRTEYPASSQQKASCQLVRLQR